MIDDNIFKECFVHLNYTILTALHALSSHQGYTIPHIQISITTSNP